MIKHSYMDSNHGRSSDKQPLHLEKELQAGGPSPLKAT